MMKIDSVDALNGSKIVKNTWVLVVVIFVLSSRIGENVSSQAKLVEYQYMEGKEVMGR